MPKKKSSTTKKSTKRSSKKVSAKSAAKSLTKSVQPPVIKLTRPDLPKRPKFEEDNPARRFGELFEDRQFGSKKSENLAELRLAAIEATRAIGPFNESSLTPATPGGNNWIELGPAAVPGGQTYGGARVLVTGRLTEIVQDPANASIIYVGSSRGGVWKTTDGGLTWTPTSDNSESLAIGALDISKSNPQ